MIILFHATLIYLFIGAAISSLLISLRYRGGSVDMVVFVATMLLWPGLFYTWIMRFLRRIKRRGRR